MIPVFPVFVNGERQKKKGSLRRPSGMVYSFVALRGAFLGAGSALVKVLGGGFLLLLHSLGGLGL